jgi:hypothetical protein
LNCDATSPKASSPIVVKAQRFCMRSMVFTWGRLRELQDEASPLPGTNYTLGKFDVSALLRRVRNFGLWGEA